MGRYRAHISTGAAPRVWAQVSTLSAEVDSGSSPPPSCRKAGVGEVEEGGLGISSQHR